MIQTDSTQKASCLGLWFDAGIVLATLFTSCAHGQEVPQQWDARCSCLALIEATTIEQACYCCLAMLHLHHMPMAQYLIGQARLPSHAAKCVKGYDSFVGSKQQESASHISSWERAGEGGIIGKMGVKMGGGKMGG